MPIVPQHTPTLRAQPFGIRHSATYAKKYELDDGLDAARGIFSGSFISALFWSAMLLAL